MTATEPKKTSEAPNIVRIVKSILYLSIFVLLLLPIVLYNVDNSGSIILTLLAALDIALFIIILGIVGYVTFLAVTKKIKTDRNVMIYCGLALIVVIVDFLLPLFFIGTQNNL